MHIGENYIVIFNLYPLFNICSLTSFLYCLLSPDESSLAILMLGSIEFVLNKDEWITFFTYIFISIPNRSKC